MPHFVRFERKSSRRSTEPRISIQKRGTFSINSVAYGMLQRGDIAKDAEDRVHVEFLFDPAERIVGIRQVKPSASTYPLRKLPRSDSYLLSGHAFAAQGGIPIDKTRRYRARAFEDGIVGFSLAEDEVTG